MSTFYDERIGTPQQEAGRRSNVGLLADGGHRTDIYIQVGDHGTSYPVGKKGVVTGVHKVDRHCAWVHWKDGECGWFAPACGFEPMTISDEEYIQDDEPLPADSASVGWQTSAPPAAEAARASPASTMPHVAEEEDSDEFEDVDSDDEHDKPTPPPGFSLVLQPPSEEQLHSFLNTDLVGKYILKHWEGKDTDGKEHGWCVGKIIKRLKPNKKDQNFVVFYVDCPNCRSELAEEEYGSSDYFGWYLLKPTSPKRQRV